QPCPPAGVGAAPEAARAGTRRAARRRRRAHRARRTRPPPAAALRLLPEWQHDARRRDARPRLGRAVGAAAPRHRERPLFPTRRLAARADPGALAASAPRRRRRARGALTGGLWRRRP